MAYQPLVYRTSGGDELVISTGGSLKGRGIDMLTTGGYIADPRFFFEQSSDAVTLVDQALTNYGVSRIYMTTDTTGARFYTVEPAPGRVKWVINQTSGSTSLTVILTTGTWDGTNTMVTFAGGSTVYPESIKAVGVSTSRWYLVNVTSGVTFS